MNPSTTASTRPTPLRVGVAGPVGSGKTALVDALCKALRDTYDIAVVTNDIYTKEDERLLVAAGALPQERILIAMGGRIPAAVARALAVRDEDIGAAAPCHAIASAHHETQYSRLFRS